jgi:hypothetical protein
MKSGSMTLHGGHVADVKKARTPRCDFINCSNAERFGMFWTGLMVAGEADKAADDTLFSKDKEVADGTCGTDSG